MTTIVRRLAGERRQACFFSAQKEVLPAKILWKRFWIKGAWRDSVQKGSALANAKRIAKTDDAPGHCCQRKMAATEGR
jgi:hypothetical protein